MEIHIRGTPRSIANITGNMVYSIGEDDNSEFLDRSGDCFLGAYRTVEMMDRAAAEDSFGAGYRISFPSKSSSGEAVINMRTTPRDGKIDAVIGFRGTKEEIKYLSKEFRHWMSEEGCVEELDP